MSICQHYIVYPELSAQENGLLSAKILEKGDVLLTS